MTNKEQLLKELELGRKEIKTDSYSANRKDSYNYRPNSLATDSIQNNFCVRQSARCGCPFRLSHRLLNK
jgi:hypothetical protein